MTTAFQHVRLEVSAGVAHLSLARPDRLNVLGFGPGSSRDEIAQALAHADANPAVACVLITAEGRSFCAGGDLAGLPENPTPAEDQQIIAMVDRFNQAVRSVSKPVIAAVHGHCLGAGLSFIAQCDLVLAAADASFGLPEGRFGHPGGSDLVPVIGQAWAKFLIFSGESINARRAAAIGLVLRVLPAEQLQSAAHELAERIARMPAQALVLNKQAIDRAAEAGGRAAARLAGRAADTITKSMSPHARAPDGQLFKDILDAEGPKGLKRAKAQQYEQPWLSDDDDLPH